MSYKTNWKLDATLPNGAAITKQKEKEINKYILYNSDMSWVFGEGLGKWGEDDRSFDNANANMEILSEKYPDILFTLKYEKKYDSR